MSLLDLPLVVNEGDPGHNVYHEILHAWIRSTAAAAVPGAPVKGGLIGESVLASGDISSTTLAGAAIGVVLVVPASNLAAIIEWEGTMYGTSTGVVCSAILLQDAVAVDSAQESPSAANAIIDFHKSFHAPPSGVDRTYSVNVGVAFGSGTAHVLAAAGLLTRLFARWC